MEKEKPKKQIKKKTILIVVNLLFSLFLAAYAVQFSPPIYLFTLQIELFLFVVLFFILLQFLLSRIIRKYLLSTYILIVFVISLFSYLGYGWSLQTMYNNLQANTIQLFTSIAVRVEIKPSVDAIAPHISLQQRIQQKVDSKDSIVRSFAVEKSLLYFDEYYFKFGQICRQLSLIKYIRDNYKYVKDPKDFDYFAPPQESIMLMAGDCDDYSILMVSTLQAIGANVRIIWSPGHVYPELYCGDKKSFDKYASAIYSVFEKEIKDKKLYYRLDKNNEYWLNIDYTDNYPGSYYLSEEVLSIIYIK